MDLFGTRLSPFRQLLRVTLHETLLAHHHKLPTMTTLVLPDLFYDQSAMCSIMSDACSEIQQMRPVKTIAGPTVDDDDTSGSAHIKSVTEFLSTDPTPSILHQQYAVLSLIYCSASLCQTLRQNTPPSIIREWLDGNGTAHTLPDFCTRYETTMCGIT